jgi:EPS-associated MarR family transcriptional regulator
MNDIKKNNQDHFEILRKISKKPEVSQRQLASELGFSLGKLNYCLKELQNKGLIKIQNFKKNKKKINYLYILTPQGISSKTKLTITFMQKKIKEYDELKSEIVNLDNVKINHPNNKKIDKSLL